MDVRPGERVPGGRWASSSESPWLRHARDIAYVIVLVGAGTFLLVRLVQYYRERSEPVPTTLLSLDDAITRGDVNARVVLVVYADFQCPACGAFARDSLPRVEAEYVRPGRIRVAFFHFPLTEIHPLAMKAAVAAVCASQQGAFWPMHDWLFAQPDLEPKAFVSEATALGLVSTSFARCLDNDDTAERVIRSKNTGKDLGIRSTPAVFVGLTDANGKIRMLSAFNGAPTMLSLKRELDAALALAR